MDRRNFINKSVGLAALGGLLLLGCHPHSEKKKKTFTVAADRCSGCGKCMKACDEHAIQINDQVAIIDLLRCKGCGDCQPLCRHNAIVQVS